jgi:hypothetical protein
VEEEAFEEAKRAYNRYNIVGLMSTVILGVGTHAGRARAGQRSRAGRRKRALQRAPSKHFSWPG